MEAKATTSSAAEEEEEEKALPVPRLAAAPAPTTHALAFPAGIRCGLTNTRENVGFQTLRLFR